MLLPRYLVIQPLRYVVLVDLAGASATSTVVSGEYGIGKKCGRCGGKGNVWESIASHTRASYRCPTCDGDGWIKEG